MRLLHWIILLLAMGASQTSLSAQTRKLDPDDSVAVERLATTLTSRLLDGIAIDSSRARRAKRLVLATLDKQLRLPMDTPDFNEVYFRLQYDRDKTMRAFLPSAKARARFDRNAAALIPSWAPVVK